MAGWDPTQYLRYADERGRPFADLVARIGAEQPARVVDLGCGPGRLTAGLAARWPGAEVTGVDSSPAMIADARRQALPDRVRFVEQDLRDWTPAEPVDVIVSNATLQWLPDHRSLLPRLLDRLTPDGWLAFQVPGNFGEPSHRLLHELAAEPPYNAFTADVERPASAEPADYLADLLALGCRHADVWETTYLHLLTGPDPVFDWIAGTGARPVLQALPEAVRATFEATYRQRLAAAYPPGPDGTVLPFRRIFAVACR
ncbi:trans-aconitate 2-methyltransferase [Friedmanniella endophytica]|uniref:Trans-aconitate 2-methyltransferase n=1 Tax=Microlunatus kandeliicorticis TaxID=1759536 RepID=A0A7W3IUU2_9ACTN|nr:trans-aconitate 2-methyltransferase [Microlunatus kandeliicorticis]MBA8795678.1 trans-aconitate 2-methyltransferase [Microlunatus kandeliicorticis]